jgi:signal peptidase II
VSRWYKPALLVLLLGPIVGCDHASKLLAQRHLVPREAVEIVPGLLDLRLVRSTDTAFSLLGNSIAQPARLYIILGLHTLGTPGLAWLVSKRWPAAGTSERIAGVLVLGGAIGNLSERWVRGHVIDFIHLHHWPVFNLADIALCVGVALLLVVVPRLKRAALS